MTVDDIKKIINPLFRRVMLMVSEGKIKKTDDKQKAQVEILSDEVRDALKILQQYGFVSRPVDDSDAVIIFKGGNRDGGIIIATDNKEYRLEIEKGEVALYTDEGDYVHLKRGNLIAVKTKKVEADIDGTTYKLTKNGIESSSDFILKANGTEYKFQSSGLETTADIKGGNIEASTGDVKAGLITLKTHKHAFTGQGSVGLPTS